MFVPMSALWFIVGAACGFCIGWVAACATEVPAPASAHA